MSASKAIKSIGLPSLSYVALHINRHPNILHEWYKHKPELFQAVIHGVKALDKLKGGDT